MGYSFYSPVMMFGFYEDYDTGMFLDSNWVYERYKDVYCYAGEINKGYNIGNVVGIVVKVSADGKLSYDEEDYKNLLRLKEDYEKYHDKKVGLQYHMAISGDYQNEATYTFDD